jgi:membrane protein DedA with SNARE-associated domain/rhodanese-related sulfurtransferase
MHLPVHLLLKYKYLVLFAWVLAEQAGIPLPSAPLLMTAGALSAEHRMSFLLALATGVVAARIADSVWFFAGRKYGARVTRLVSKMSIHPPTCVRCARDLFDRRGRLFLILAKFVPGVSLIAPPVAGQYGMSFALFSLLDGIGSVLWVSLFLAAGRYFGDLIKRNAKVLHVVVHFAGALILVAIAGILLARLFRHRTALKALTAARVTPQELKRRLDAGESVFIVDLRHPLELLPDPFMLPGAIHFSPEELTAHQSEIPRDREIVLYCTCPSEATAAKTAMMLRRFCIDQVRPLRGGFDEWKRLGYPLQPIPPLRPSARVMQSAG